MKIHLIRHGMTKANEEKLYCGWQNLSLSDKGIKHLKTLKEHYSYPYGDIYISSPMKRCIETLKILYRNAVISETFEGFKEINFGDFEGKNYDYLKDLSEYQNWLTDYEVHAPPNGENYLVFKERVMQAFNDVLIKYEDKGANLIIVTHGGVIRTIMSEWVDTNILFFDWKVPCGLGYTIDTETKEYTQIH